MSIDVEKSIGKSIACFRRERSLTQAQLAERIEVATETISRLERGVSITSLKTLENISRALDVDLKDFFDIKLIRRVSKSTMDIEIAKIVTLLKPMTVEEVRMGYNILKGVFEAVKRTYKARE